ncbi:hypothetical protein EMPS_01708 [Entomortierella parvispora]|uniref:E2F-associated phosphoprotein n=1 Tax=Entomortierella parvispora TaxID=205924 RepID=A0A9P3H428_9FUNG|nr:hypothetical protein EMPS_01708 [Entomortierella parvispora]
MSATRENQGNDKKVQFMVADADLDVDLHDLSEGLDGGQPEEKPDYYDPVYFDSDSYEEDSDDEKPDADEEDYDKRAGLSASTDKGKGKVGDMSEITAGLQQTSLQASDGSKKSKKQPTISNEELLYDPDEDDRDEQWLIKKIAANRPPGCKPEDIWTDAILSCPMCLTQLCFDCQQHEDYQHQFRAMFVENCRTIDNEVLRFPKEAAAKRRGGKKTKSATVDSSSISLDPSISGANAAPQNFKPSADDDEDMAYNPVVCGICSTKVALVDQDEVYHFFNVIPTGV